MRNKSLKIIVGILSIVIASLFLSIIEITNVIKFGNVVIEVSFLGLCLLAIAEGIYLLSILISGVIAKYLLWKNEKELYHSNKGYKNLKKRQKKLEELKRGEVVNES